jgi:hypothetical protein
MTFLISLETPTRGYYTIGFLEVPHEELKEKEVMKAAQRKVVEMLVSSGFDRDKIGIQVSDYTSLEIGIHRVLIIPIKEFDGQAASTLAALLM